MDLSGEIGMFLLGVVSPSDPLMSEFLSSIPAGPARSTDYILIVQMQVWLSTGQRYDEVIAMLSANCFPTVANEVG